MSADIPTGDADSASILQWKEGLVETLSKLERAYIKYDSAASRLSACVPYGKRPTVPSAEQTVEAVIHEWISEKCKEVTSRFNEGTYAEVKRSELEHGSINLRDREHRKLWEKGNNNPAYESPIGNIIEFALKIVNIEAVYSEIMETGRGLGEEGLRDAALEMGQSLGMASYTSNSVIDSLSVRTVKGRFLLNLSYSDEWRSDRTRKLDNLLKYAELFEDESGVAGLGALITSCIDSEQEKAVATNSSTCRVDSRVRNDIEGVGSAVFFSDKITFHIGVHIFEALVAFMKTFVPIERQRRLVGLD